MDLRDFTRYADSMKEVATEIHEFESDWLDSMRMNMDRLGSLQRVPSAIWRDSSPMMQMMQAQQQVNMQQHDALQREYSTGGLFSALGGLFRGL